MSIEKKGSGVTSREFLDFVEHNSNRVEELVKIGKNKIEIEDWKRDSCEELKSTPPWEREPIEFNSDILRRTQDFLSMCNEIGGREIVENGDTAKEVVMDVHLGVFDVNGKVPDNQFLSSKNIIDVPICKFDDVTEDNAGDKYFLDDSDRSNSVDTKIYKILNDRNRNKDLIQVISSSEDK